MLTVDIEKAFDSVDHQFLINVLKNFEFEKNPVRLIKKTSKKSEVIYNKWRNNHEVFQIRNRYTPRRYDISCSF